MKRKKPLVSICSTVFNNSKIIKRSIDSIIRQLPGFSRNFEFVIVDNFSTDGTWSILSEFASKYNNITISQSRCTLGKGRAIAYNLSRGKYVTFVDLDQLYESTFSKILLNAVKHYKPFTIVNGLMDRVTMDKIGNWGDFLGGEEYEFQGRAMSKGIKIYMLPVHVFRNQIVRTNRQKRYARNLVSKFIRAYKHIDVRIRAVGFKNLKVVKGRSNIGTILAKLSFIKSTVLKEKFYRYSDYRSNEEYFWARNIILSPTKFNIPKKYWIAALTPRAISYTVFNRSLLALTQIGFNRLEFVGYKHLLIYTDKTDTNIINFYKEFYTVFDEY